MPPITVPDHIVWYAIAAREKNLLKQFMALCRVIAVPSGYPEEDRAKSLEELMREEERKATVYGQSADVYQEELCRVVEGVIRSFSQKHIAHRFTLHPTTYAPGTEYYVKQYGLNQAVAYDGARLEQFLYTNAVTLGSFPCVTLRRVEKREMPALQEIIADLLRQRLNPDEEIELRVVIDFISTMKPAHELVIFQTQGT